MFAALEDSIFDSVKLLPFLFFTYLLMEYLEERMTGKTKKVLEQSGKSGPAWGALLGVVPQCGFSAAASNLYTGRVITMGTLIAVYLSTSDEMLPILISKAVSPVLIFKILLIKAVFGMTAGFLIDLVMQRCFRQMRREPDIHHFCEHEHCRCGKGILRPALRHTLQIFLFILGISLLINLLIEWMGTDVLADFILQKPVVGEALSGLIGLIPNCAASVVITQLFLDGALSFGTMMSGLLVSSGIGVLILFRVNDDRKNNLLILFLLYAIGVLGGILINLFYP